MKKFLCLFLSVITLLSFISCNDKKDDSPIQNGTYVAVGDYKSYSIGGYEVSNAPYLRLNTNNKLFGLALLSSSGYEEQGPYGFDEFGVLVATSHGDAVYRFEVIDRNTLIFKSPADNIYKIPIDTTFVFSKDFK